MNLNESKLQAVCDLCMIFQMESKPISIVIPAYNEENGIQPTVERIQKMMGQLAAGSEIIVVNDGSADKTAEVTAKLDVKLINHPKNLGYGRSLLSGIYAAKNEWIGIIDADGTYDPNDFLKMTPLMANYDMITGVRDLRQHKQSPLLKLLRLLLRSIIVFFSSKSSPDANSGIRLFRKAIVIGNESLYSLQYSFSTSLTLFSHLTNRFVEYVPVTYAPRVGYSKVRHVRDSIRTLKLILGMSLIYRSFRYFATILVVGFVFYALLTASAPFIGPTYYVSSVFLLCTVLLVVCLGALTSVIGKVYFKVSSLLTESRLNRK